MEERGSSSAYIMADPDEPERIRRKTSRLLIRHHLDWFGLQEGQSFVDFGCATGQVVAEAARVSGTGRVIGLDGDARMLEEARREARSLGITNAEFRQALIAGAGSTGLPTAAFDHAWTRFFLEYQKDPKSVIEEMVRLLKPGGKLDLVDLDGNCVWHYPMADGLAADLQELMADLATTGFDPYVGSKLRAMAENAGLEGVREVVEPYHLIVGAPDASTADAWRRKVAGIRKNYSERLFPQKAKRMDAVFDRLLDFILDADTMTWSLIHLVQGTKPQS